MGIQASANKDEPAPTSTTWRDCIPVDPLASDMPPSSPEEFADIVADVREAGICNEITIYRDAEGRESILDGCLRLDAAEAAGLPVIKDGALNFDVVPHRYVEGNVNREKYIRRQNLLRRHLNSEQKRSVVAKLLKSQPEQSDRSIARQAGVDNKTVASERAKLEAREEIPHSETHQDKTGRHQPARKPKAARSGTPAQHHHADQPGDGANHDCADGEPNGADHGRAEEHRGLEHHNGGEHGHDHDHGANEQPDDQRGHDEEGHAQQCDPAEDRVNDFLRGRKGNRKLNNFVSAISSIRTQCETTASDLFPIPLLDQADVQIAVSVVNDAVQALRTLEARISRAGANGAGRHGDDAVATHDQAPPIKTPPDDGLDIPWPFLPRVAS